MPHGLFLVKELQDKEYLHSLQASNAIRASINVAHGIVDAVGVVQHATPRSYMKSGDFCPAGVDCDLYDLIPIGKVFYSGVPALFMDSVLFEIERGLRRSFAERIQAIDEANPAVEVTGAHLLGRGLFDAVVEVRSDDVDAALLALLDVTDIAGTRSHILHIRPDDVRGKGSTLVSGTS